MKGGICIPHNVKSRLWWFIGYPESLPYDWIDKLTLTGVPFIVSPLHNLDTQSTGELKKEHYHIIVCFSSPTTFNHVKNTITSPLNCPIPTPLLNIQGGFEYLTHKNNPDKAQYSEGDISFHNGADRFEYVLSYDAVYSFIENLIIIERPKNLLALLRLCPSNSDAVSLIRAKPYYFCALLKDI